MQRKLCSPSFVATSLTGGRGCWGHEVRQRFMSRDKCVGYYRPSVIPRVMDNLHSIGEFPRQCTVGLRVDLIRARRSDQSAALV